MITVLLRLYYEYFKVGLFSVGGGLATVPFLCDMGERTGWFTPVDVANMVAIAESTPGAIGVNMATYVGFTVDGILGAFVATAGLISPAIIIIILIAKFLMCFEEKPIVQNTLYGLRPASVGLIAAAGLVIAQSAFLNPEADSISDFVLWKCLLLGIVLFFVEKKVKIHPVFYILIGAVAGIVFRLGGV